MHLQKEVDPKAIIHLQFHEALQLWKALVSTSKDRTIAATHRGNTT